MNADHEGAIAGADGSRQIGRITPDARAANKDSRKVAGRKRRRQPRRHDEDEYKVPVGRTEMDFTA